MKTTKEKVDWNKVRHQIFYETTLGGVNMIYKIMEVITYKVSEKSKLYPKTYLACKNLSQARWDLASTLLNEYQENIREQKEAS